VAKQRNAPRQHGRKATSSLLRKNHARISNNNNHFRFLICRGGGGVATAFRLSGDPLPRPPPRATLYGSDTMSTRSRTRSGGHDVPSPHWAAAEPGFGFEILDRDEEVAANGGDEDESEGASDASRRVQVETVEDSEAQDDEDARGVHQGRDEARSASDTDDGLSDGSSLGGGTGDGSPNLNQLVQLTLDHC
jgi:hypothetical protein